MRFVRSVLAFSLLLLSAPVWSQTSPQTAQGTTTAASLMQQSLAALAAGLQVNDVTMLGKVTADLPTGTETGTITLTATAAGQSQVVLNLPSGTRSDLRDYLATPHTGTESGPQGSKAELADNLVGPNPAWFYPALILSGVGPANFGASYIGQETNNGATVQHVALLPPGQQIAPVSLPGGSTRRIAGQHDLYLDPATSLPVSLVRSNRLYLQHPEKAAPVLRRPAYIPEEIRYSNYQLVQGLPVAFHVQVYQNGNLFLDIQLSSVNFNTGVIISTPAN